jgi:hypothetical protein
LYVLLPADILFRNTAVHASAIRFKLMDCRMPRKTGHQRPQPSKRLEREPRGNWSKCSPKVATLYSILDLSAILKGERRLNRPGNAGARTARPGYRASPSLDCGRHPVTLNGLAQAKQNYDRTIVALIDPWAYVDRSQEHGEFSM